MFCWFLRLTRNGIHLSRRILTTSDEVTLNGRFVRESFPKNPLHPGLGIISPIVGGHKQPLKRVTYCNHPKKGHQQNCQECVCLFFLMILRLSFDSNPFCLQKSCSFFALSILGRSFRKYLSGKPTQRLKSAIFNRENIKVKLLMEEIPHQLRCMKPCK